ncbi:protein COFACTOR ASSEMBLY OF COMPLEX C SUBUNIT B CCB1, chloroplastic [Cinnamomum micranthum f. kanehirae]|uniref:Protein COFACTOR ASSEMBLY OF COMPLEX C SUBUNIT B CCB1, chloroplastic n=1 Tax=Cinnamomum micranthum f. kanehirae TaxID=337451 RepID=A0A3S3PVT4_9MAGN|nr:protein COFACTOR ASSEMBLY OF COMPLEX C SUBUNIT B CCB1, chloroplastic [Cinnamomum micranthum f. kanehirae]
MAAKFLSPACLSSVFTLPTSQSKPRSHFRCIHQEPWLRQGRASRPRRPVVCLSLHDPLSSSTPAELFSVAETVGYSLASYYTSLGLFVISVPGLWSLIKRSVKSKIVQKTFIGDEKKAPNQAAGEILSFFTRNNFVVLDRGETVTFEGIMVPNRGQAALLTFCTCISLASVALVLTITVPEGGNNWYWLTILSPLAGAYYWKRASRKEQIKVKMLVGDDGRLSEVIVQGDDQQVEQMRKELQLSEKGMVYVKGIFER